MVEKGISPLGDTLKAYAGVAVWQAADLPPRESFRISYNGQPSKALRSPFGDIAGIDVGPGSDGRPVVVVSSYKGRIALLNTRTRRWRTLKNGRSIGYFVSIWRHRLAYHRGDRVRLLDIRTGHVRRLPKTGYGPIELRGTTVLVAGLDIQSTTCPVDSSGGGEFIQWLVRPRSKKVLTRGCNGVSAPFFIGGTPAWMAGSTLIRGSQRIALKESFELTFDGRHYYFMRITDAQDSARDVLRTTRLADIRR
ncbi:MAG TPA: hypothetical protein VNT22_07985 [Baekduia sp.]|nr:hypothetical protein [Baekduia sp.]